MGRYEGLIELAEGAAQTQRRFLRGWWILLAICTTGAILALAFGAWVGLVVFVLNAGFIAGHAIPTTKASIAEWEEDAERYRMADKPEVWN